MSVVTAQAKGNAGTGYIKVTVDDGQTQWSQLIGVAIKGTATGIYSIRHDAAVSDKNAPCYDLSGRRIGQPGKKGLYIQNGKKYIVR